MTTSRAWSFMKMGGPEVLTLAEHELADPGQGEALVELESIGLNRSDLLYLAGRYITQPPAPSFLGQEAVGRIVALGPDGGPPPANGYAAAVGDRVALLVGRVDYTNMGTFRTAGVYPQSALIPHPGPLSADVGASLWLTGLTAYGALHAGAIDAATAKGRTVLVTAASSGVGIAALQIARAWQATTIASTTSSDKAEALAEHADHVVVTDDLEQAASTIRGLTDDRGVDAVLDPVGYAYAELFYRVAGVGAQIIYYGMMAGEGAPLDLVALLRGNLGVHGFTIYRLFRTPEVLDDAIASVGRLAEDGALVPIVDSVYPFSEAPAALTAMTNNEHLGKIIVRAGEGEVR